MAVKKNVEIQDHEGNIYHPHTSSKVVFREDGTNVEASLAQMATEIGNKAASNHNHDTAYAQKTHMHDYAPSNHNHDSRYYTEGEVNNLLNSKAPAGHGLGTNCAEVTGNDCNQLTTNGWYMGCNLANAPNADWYMIQNVVHHEGWIVQWAFSFATTPLCWYRLKSNGVWGPWMAYAKPIDGMTRARKQMFSTASPSGVDWDIWYQHE